MKPLNATAATLLGFLQDETLTGWELTTRIETMVGHFWNTTRSQIYRELKNLGEMGFVEAGEPGARDRTPYSITPEGKEAFVEWISRPPGPELIRFPFLLTLFFGRFVDTERLGRFVRAEKLRHQERLDVFEKAERLSPPPSLENSIGLALGYGLAYERAVVTWFDEIENLLD